MYRYLLASIVVLIVAMPTPCNAEQDVIADVRKVTDDLANMVKIASVLVDQPGQSSKLNKTFRESLDRMEKHYGCKATKTVELNPELKMITITFVSRTDPVLSVLIIARNQKLVLQRVAVGEVKIVDFDPLGLDQ